MEFHKIYGGLAIRIIVPNTPKIQPIRATQLKLKLDGLQREHLSSEKMFDDVTL